MDLRNVLVFMFFLLHCCVYSQVTVDELDRKSKKKYKKALKCLSNGEVDKGIAGLQTVVDDNPDFAVLAKAFQIDAFTVNTVDEVDAGIDRLLAAEGPILMHVKIDPNENVWPLVPPGRSNADMMER